MATRALRHPGLTLGVLLAVTAVLGVGVARLDTAVGYRAFLGDTHPAVERLDAFVERFGGGVRVAAIWSCAEVALCESVFDDAALRMGADVARRVEAVDGVLRVSSPATSRSAVARAARVAGRHRGRDRRAPRVE
jgi:predicted RND superfamily exporter protein